MRVPMLVTGAAGGYAAWKPMMENYLLRQGVADGDYKVSNPDWAKLVTAVESWSDVERREAVAFVLSASSSSKVKTLSKEEKEAAEVEKSSRAVVKKMVENSGKAFTILYVSLTDELRLLVQDVQKGYAFGIWDFLLKRFQNTEQDNVGDLWHQYVSLVQQENEEFVEYKARVDATRKLLVHAKATMDDLYSYLVLCRLRPLYAGAVLALKADKLKDAAAVRWDEVVTFMANQERGANRVALNDGAPTNEKVMTARGKYGGASQGGNSRQNTRSRVRCFTCQELGHYMSECPMYEQEESGGGGGGGAARRRPGDRSRETVESARAYVESSGDEDDGWERTY